MAVERDVEAAREAKKKRERTMKLVAERERRLKAEREERERRVAEEERRAAFLRRGYAQARVRLRKKQVGSVLMT
jgi:hypothetical protein